MMATPEGAQFSQIIHRKMEELKKLCEKVDEATASRAPAGRWSPKEILSHVCGPEGVGFLPSIQTILDKETPRLDIKPEDPFFTEKRRRMTLKELLSEFDMEYRRIAKLAEGLSEKQLNRKAHIPMLKDSPIGEYPTLAVWIRAIGEQHLSMHIDHMKEILQGLGVAIG